MDAIAACESYSISSPHSPLCILLQLSYADMLMINRVDPLRRELGALEKKAETTQIRGEEMAHKDSYS